jgi:hypothetical protein
VLFAEVVSLSADTAEPHSSNVHYVSSYLTNTTETSSSRPQPFPLAITRRVSKHQGGELRAYTRLMHYRLASFTLLQAKARSMLRGGVQLSLRSQPR